MFVDVPERCGLRAYVCMNPVSPITYATSSPLSTAPPPADGPLDASKPILVFVHAPTASTASFSRQFADPRLRAVANLVGIDLRLHGRTTAGEWKEGKYTIDDSAECAMAVLDKLDFPGFFLFGEGVLGCRVSSWLAIRRPEKVLGIILASPAFPVEDPSICQSLEELGKFLCLNKGPGGSGACPPEALEGIASYFFGSEPRQKERKDEFKEAFEKRYGAGFPPDDTLALASYGRRAAIPADKLAQVKACEEWQRAFKNAKGGARLHTIASAPTLMSWSDYGIVNRVVAQFVQQAQSS
ncbi:hypothetical protein JCM10213v2_003266 [Rhodosporidiobolus nylandii]